MDVERAAPDFGADVRALLGQREVCGTATADAFAAFFGCEQRRPEHIAGEAKVGCVGHDSREHFEPKPVVRHVVVVVAGGGPTANSCDVADLIGKPTTMEGAEPDVTDCAAARRLEFADADGFIFPDLQGSDGPREVDGNGSREEGGCVDVGNESVVHEGNGAFTIDGVLDIEGQGAAGVVDDEVTGEPRRGGRFEDRTFDDEEWAVG